MSERATNGNAAPLVGSCLCCGQPYEFKRVSVSLEFNSISFGKRTVLLAPQLATIAAVLAETMPRLASRAFLMERIYGALPQPDDNILDVQISHLRRAIRSLPLRIDVVRGSGWRFVMRGSMSTEWAVMGEAPDGAIKVIRRRFTSKDAAEDYPVRLVLWRRVWVEAITPPILLPTRSPRDRSSRADLAYAEILAAVLAGDRCPQNYTGHIDARTVRELAGSGRIRVDVYARNWRVVTITDGPHKGKATAPPPGIYGPAYVTITKEGRHMRARA